MQTMQPQPVGASKNEQFIVAQSIVQKPEVDEDDVLNRSIIFQRDIGDFIMKYQNSKDRLINELLLFLKTNVLSKSKDIGILLSLVKAKVIELNISKNLKKPFVDAFKDLNIILDLSKYNTYRIICEYDKRINAVWSQAYKELEAKFAKEKQVIESERDELKLNSETKKTELEEAQKLLAIKLQEAEKIQATLISTEQSNTNVQTTLKENIAKIQEEIEAKSKALNANNELLLLKQQAIEASTKTLESVQQLLKSKVELLSVKEEKVKQIEQALQGERQKASELETKLNETMQDLDTTRQALNETRQEMLNVTRQNTELLELSKSKLKESFLDGNPVNVKLPAKPVSMLFAPSKQLVEPTAWEELKRYWSDERITLLKMFSEMLESWPAGYAEDEAFFRSQINMFFDKEIPVVAILEQLKPESFASIDIQQKIQKIQGAINEYNKSVIIRALSGILESWPHGQYAEEKDFVQLQMTNLTTDIEPKILPINALKLLKEHIFQSGNNNIQKKIQAINVDPLIWPRDNRGRIDITKIKSYGPKIKSLSSSKDKPGCYLINCVKKAERQCNIAKQLELDCQKIYLEKYENLKAIVEEVNKRLTQSPTSGLIAAT